MSKTGNIIIIALASLQASGCGTALPVMDYAHLDEANFSRFVQNIVGHVRCELGQAIQTEYNPNFKNNVANLKKWAAKIALTINSSDKTQFNPGFSLFNVSQSVAASLGLQLQADATREMTMTYFLTFDELLHDKYEYTAPDNTLGPFGKLSARCGRAKKFDGQYEIEPIAGDLGIHLTLKSAMESWTAAYSLSNRIKDGPFDTITHHVNFNVTGTGSVNQSLKFENVSSGTSGNLLSATRSRKDELLITMGPLELGTRKTVPSRSLDETFFVERLKSAIPFR